MANRILVLDDDLVVLDRFHALIVSTGEVIPTFAGGDGLFGGGSDGPPPPSEEEKLAYKKQAEATDLYLQMAKRQQATADALEPYLYKQLGLTKTQVQGEREQNIARIQAALQNTPQTIQQSVPGLRGRTGIGPATFQTVTNPAYTKLQEELAAWQAKPQTYSIDELPPDASELQRREIQGLANQREIAALKGELPVDPSVESDITRGEAQMREELARRGIKPGSGDIYNRAIGEYQKGANALRYGVRRGEMTTADAIASNRQNELMRKQSQYIDQATSQRRAGADMLGTGAGMQGDIANMYTGQRFKAYDYKVQQDMARAGGVNDLIGAGIGAAGTIGGASLLSSMAPTTIGTSAFMI